MKFYKDFDLKEFVAETYLLENLPDGKYYYKECYRIYCVSVKNGKKHGIEEKYYNSNGNIEQITNYENGRKQGLEISYNKDGTKTVEKYYENGFMLYEIHFQRKKEKTLEQIKQLERVLKELKESVGETGCKELLF